MIIQSRRARHMARPPLLLAASGQQVVDVREGRGGPGAWRLRQGVAQVVRSIDRVPLCYLCTHESGGDTLSVAALVRAAASGDRAAWDALVDQYASLVWSVTRAHRLSDADAADVSQTTWLRLVERLDGLREPERVGAWLATTARRECLRTLGGRQREVVADLDALPGGEDGAGTALLERERAAVMRSAFARLGERCQRLLRVLMADPAPGYDEVAAALDMPIGSIGPTRARCLERLRRDGGLVALALEGGA